LPLALRLTPSVGMGDPFPGLIGIAVVEEVFSHARLGFGSVNERLDVLARLRLTQYLVHSHFGVYCANAVPAFKDENVLHNSSGYPQLHCIKRTFNHKIVFTCLHLLSATDAVGKEVVSFCVGT